MTDHERPIHDPTTDAEPDTDTPPLDVPDRPVEGVPPTGDSGTFGAPVTVPGPDDPAMTSRDEVVETADPGPTSEATTGSAATGPVVTGAAAADRQRRTRWVAAGGIIAIIVALTALATLALTSGAPSSTVSGYVPTDSLMYGEVRLDLPGDQRQKVGQFLSKFPGFADQAALETKLDEVLDRLTSDSTDGEQVYTRDIKPWFDGQVAFSVGSLPTSADPETAAAEVRALMLISIKDETLARAWFDQAMADQGASGTTEDYGGTRITVFDDVDRGVAQYAFAIVGGRVAMAGDLVSVKAAIDTKGASGLASTEAFTAASTALEGDQVGFLLLDLRAITDATLRMTEAGGGTPFGASLTRLVPEWAAMRLRVEADALVGDWVAPDVEGAPGPTENRANGVADHVPPSTILMVAGNDAGATLLETIELYRSEPDMAEAFDGIDQAAGIIGGLDAALGWMGDSAIVVAPGASGDGFEGGIVSVPADAAGAKQLLTTLRSFILLAGTQGGFTVRDEAYGGTTITIVDLGTAADLGAFAGAFGGMPLPTEPGALPDDRVELAYAATDSVVVIGASPGFVRQVLDAGAGASLADDARYQGLVGRAGAEHIGVTFLDLAGVRSLVEAQMTDASPEERAEYEESIQPFLAPFDALVATSVAGDDLDQSHLVLTIE